jgi:hypothetical protein
MTRAFYIMAIATIGVIAAVFVATAVPASATTVTSSAFQSGWQQALARIEVPLQVQGYVMVAGATVRDHRSCAPNCGTFNTPTYGHHGGGRMDNPPSNIAR